jgi:nucleoid DNA-binding protein
MGRVRPEFAAAVAKKLGKGWSRDNVQKVLAACIGYGKDIIQEGDTWRLPGLGKFFCVDLPATQHLDRFKLAEGKRVMHDLPPRKRVKFKFQPYSSANEQVSDEIEPGDFYGASVDCDDL